MGALIRAGAGDAVVYGLYVVTAPLIVLGAFWAARSAVREDWLGLIVASALMLVAAASAFAGPRGVWLSDGVGGCVVLLGYAPPTPGSSGRRDRAYERERVGPIDSRPARLQIVATLAALPAGDALSFTRLQEMIGLTPAT